MEHADIAVYAVCQCLQHDGATQHVFAAWGVNQWTADRGDDERAIWLGGNAAALGGSSGEGSAVVEQNVACTSVTAIIEADVNSCPVLHDYCE